MDSSVTRRILQILAGAPTSQLLFSEYHSEQSINFSIRDQADTDYSCFFTQEAIDYIFIQPNSEGTNIEFENGELDIVYPSVVLLSFNSHVASLICISPDEIYYIDYYQEMKRDMRDVRTWGLNYFLYMMNEYQLNSIIQSIITSVNHNRLFIGCNPRLDNRYDDNIKLEVITMYTDIINYNDIQEFYDLLQSRREVIRDRIINNPELSISSILDNISMPLDGHTYDWINHQLIDGYNNYYHQLIRLLDSNYEILMDNINLINRDIHSYNYV